MAMGIGGNADCGLAAVRVRSDGKPRWTCDRPDGDAVTPGIRGKIEGSGKRYAPKVRHRNRKGHYRSRRTTSMDAFAVMATFMIAAPIRVGVTKGHHYRRDALLARHRARRPPHGQGEGEGDQNQNQRG